MSDQGRGALKTDVLPWRDIIPSGRNVRLGNELLFGMYVRLHTPRERQLSSSNDHHKFPQDRGEGWRENIAAGYNLFSSLFAATQDL